MVLTDNHDGYHINIILAPLLLAVLSIAVVHCYMHHCDRS